MVVTNVLYRQPHSGTSSSISNSPIPSPITSSSFDSPLCSPRTPSGFHSRLKPTRFTNLSPVISLLPSGLPSPTIARIVSSELYSVLCSVFRYFSFLLLKCQDSAEDVVVCAEYKKTYPLLVRTFTTYVRPLLEYNSIIWSPHLKKDIEAVEKVQRRFTKRLSGINTLSYS